MIVWITSALEWIRDIVIVPLIVGAYSGLVVTRYLEFQSARRAAVSEAAGFELTYLKYVSAEPGDEEDSILDDVMDEPLSALMFSGHIEAAAQVLELKHNIEDYFGDTDRISDGPAGASKFSVNLLKRARSIPPDWCLILFGMDLAAFIARKRGRIGKIMEYIDGTADDWR